MSNNISLSISKFKNNRVAKYVLVSGGLTIIGMMLVYFFIVFLMISKFWSSIIVDFLCGTIQFIALRNYIFYAKTTLIKTLIQYLVYYGNWIIAMFLVAFIFIQILEVAEVLIPWNIISIPFSKGLAMLIMFIWNYNIHKYLTYKIK